MACDGDCSNVEDREIIEIGDRDGMPDNSYGNWSGQISIEINGGLVMHMACDCKFGKWGLRKLR